MCNVAEMELMNRIICIAMTQCVPNYCWSGRVPEDEVVAVKDIGRRQHGYEVDTCLVVDNIAHVPQVCECVAYDVGTVQMEESLPGSSTHVTPHRELRHAWRTSVNGSPGVKH